MVIMAPFDDTEINLERGALEGLRTLTIRTGEEGSRWSHSMLPPSTFETCEGSRREVYRLRTTTRCRCNATHAVAYAAHHNASADAAVYVVGAGMSLPRVATSKASTNFLLYMEPPHNLEFTSAPGFDGLVGFRRPAGGGVGVWHPWCGYRQLWEYPARARTRPLA